MLAASDNEASTCSVRLSGSGTLLGSETISEKTLQPLLAYIKLPYKTWSFDNTRSAPMVWESS